MNKKIIILVFGILITLAIAGISLFILSKPKIPPIIIPAPENKITVKQTGGAGILPAECADKSYITETTDYIIEGTVEKVESKWNEERTSIFTNTDLKIDKYVKGTPFTEDKLQIITPGGTSGEIRQWTEDQPIFQEGKKVRIYFKETDGGFSMVCGEMGVENIIRIEKPSQFHLMHFGAQLTFASGDMFIGIDELKEQLKVIEETGADVIRIDMDYEAWMTSNQDNIKRHDEIIKQIKNDGKLLMLADRGAISFKKNKVTWDYFKEQHLKHTKIFAEKYKPNYYVVIKEPIWYYKFYSMISTNTTPEMWRDLASEACTIVKEVNPETKCAVAVYASGEREKDFFALSANIANLDIMGVDVYDDKDIQATTNDLIPLVPQGKEFWMLESWNGGASSYLQPWKENEDAEWINKSVRFAQKNNFSGYIVYYPVHFSSYTKLRDIDWSKRTLPFYAYKSVIEEVRNTKR